MALGLAPAVFAFFFYLPDAYEFVSTGSAESQRVWQVSHDRRRLVRDGGIVPLVTRYASESCRDAVSLSILCPFSRC